MTPSLRSLITFEAAARHCSFRQAALELSLTQSAVSKQIRQLEDMMGVALFERVRQRVVLTDIGQKYFQDIARILENLSETTHRVVSSQSGTAQITISSLPTFAVRWLLPRIPDFLAKNGDIQVNFTTNLVPFFFRSETFDVAIHYGSRTVAGSASYFLMREKIVPVCSPIYRRQLRIRHPDDLNNAVLLQRTTRPDEWLEWSQHHNVTLHATRCGPRFDHFPVLVQAAAHHMGVALAPHFFVRDELALGQLTMLFDSNHVSKSAYYLVVPEAKQHSRPVRAFRDWLLETVHRESERQNSVLRAAAVNA